MDSLSIYKIHLNLLDGVLFSSTEENSGFVTVKSYLNDNWYDSITITNPDSINWETLLASADKLEEDEIDYALYFPIEFLAKLESRIGPTFKRVGGDAYMLLEKIPDSLVPISSEATIKPVSIENFNDYKNLINEVHGGEMGWPASSRFADRMFNVQEANSQNGKQVGLFVAYDDDKPVGYCSSITSAELNITYLTASGVLSAYRGKGIYSHMANFRLNAAKEQGIESAYVITGQESKSWNAAKKFGYKEVGRFEYYLRNNS